jgi:hypothetical protein
LNKATATRRRDGTSNNTRRTGKHAYCSLGKKAGGYLENLERVEPANSSGRFPKALPESQPLQIWRFSKRLENLLQALRPPTKSLMPR